MSSYRRCGGVPSGHRPGTATATSSANSQPGHSALPATSSGTRRIREATPPKEPNGSSSSSSSPLVVNGFELFPGVPDLSGLTSEQKLEIVQRLKRGENISGAGWDQFLPKKEPAVKIVIDASECSEIRGQGSGQLAESLEAIDEAREEEDGEDTTLVEKTEVEGEYQPEICKLVDDFVETHDNYKLFMERAIEAVVEKNFAEAFPEARVASLFNETGRFMESLEAFNTQSPAENLKLFFPSDPTSPEKKTLDCPVEQQEEFLTTVYELSGIMSKLDKHMQSDSWRNMESKVEDKMRLYKKTVDKMERDLKELEKRKKSIVEGYSLLATFANPNASGSSGDMFNMDLEFLKD